MPSLKQTSRPLKPTPSDYLVFFTSPISNHDFERPLKIPYYRKTLLLFITTWILHLIFMLLIK